MKSKVRMVLKMDFYIEKYFCPYGTTAILGYPPKKIIDTLLDLNPLSEKGLQSIFKRITLTKKGDTPYTHLLSTRYTMSDIVAKLLRNLV